MAQPDSCIDGLQCYKPLILWHYQCDNVISGVCHLYVCVYF